MLLLFLIKMQLLIDDAKSQEEEVIVCVGHIKEDS